VEENENEKVSIGKREEREKYNSRCE